MRMCRCNAPTHHGLYKAIRRFSETQDALAAAAERLKELCGMTDGDARTLAQSALEDIEALREKR